MSVYHTHAQCLQRSEEVSDGLILELQMVVGCHADAENQTQVFFKSSKRFDP